MLATMEAHFPAPQDLKRGEDQQLRWTVRTKDNSGFIFVNNYERLQHLSVKKGVILEACGIRLPKLTIPSGCMAIFPVNIEGIRYATAQLVARRNGKIYMMQVPGIPTTIALSDGKMLKNQKPKGAAQPIYKNIYLLSRHDAEHLFLGERPQPSTSVCPYEKIKDAGTLRTIQRGRAKVAEAPKEEDWQQAAVYTIQLPQTLSAASSPLLQIDYRGDCARLYADGKLVADNFYYGRPFMYGLWRLPKGCTKLELRILPLQPNAPIYLPREAEKVAGEALNTVMISCEK